MILILRNKMKPTSPIAIARAATLTMAKEPQAIGDFLSRIQIDENVYEFRFVSMLSGYEGWQWAVTLYHDQELNEWTVNETVLIPTDDSILAPPWIPWRERLQPSDVTVTDALGTAPEDSRIEDGFVHTYVDRDMTEDEKEAVERFRLTRHHVLTAPARQKIAQRWYDGPHGMKSLSTQIAAGHMCENCAFFIPIRGDLGELFGVCANKWSPDDGRVVALDHGCGEHSEIEPQQSTGMWPDRRPSYDDLYIDIIPKNNTVESQYSRVLENLDDTASEEESSDNICAISAITSEITESSPKTL
ncbi:MAG: DUF3027 domain-containing protein [Aeriscardovia sp.]|nr:DUF3027 domain-containing protein [Aeriscardovia sp.]